MTIYVYSYQTLGAKKKKAREIRKEATHGAESASGGATRNLVVATVVSI